MIQRSVTEQGIPTGSLTLGTDNGSAFCARATKLVLSALGVTYRRGGYRDPESQAFIESWFRYLKERCVWRNEFETLDQAREVIAAYIDHYHDRPHSRLNYRTPREVRQLGPTPQDNCKKKRPELSTPAGSAPVSPTQESTSRRNLKSTSSATRRSVPTFTPSRRRLRGTDADEPALRAVVEETERRCPVFNLLTDAGLQVEMQWIGRPSDPSDTSV